MPRLNCFLVLRRSILLLVLFASASTLFGARLFYTGAQGFLAYDTQFRGQFNSNGLSASGNFSNVDPGFGNAVSQQFSSSANLSTGQLRSHASASNNGTNADYDFALTNVIAEFGDTIYSTGSASGAATIDTTIDITGSWATFLMAAQRSATNRICVFCSSFRAPSIRVQSSHPPTSSRRRFTASAQTPYRVKTCGFRFPLAAR